MRRAASLVALLTAALPWSSADANGRFPATTNVRFQPGETDTILLPVTFGLLISHDGGESFRWVCEDAVGYSGVYDPDYAITETGEIYATTFEGLRVSTDGGCSWQGVGAPLTDDKFINQVEVGPDGRVWATTSTGGRPNDVYVAAAVGEDFVPTGDLYTEDNGWWLSVTTTPADPMRIYVTGYLPAGSDKSPPVGRVRRSTDGGETWENLDASIAVEGGDVAWGDAQPLFYVLGASPTDEDVVFARAVAVNPPLGDAIYRSIDGGQSWEKMIDFADTLGGFVMRSDGTTVIAGTSFPCIDEAPDAGKGCVRISTDADAETPTWTATAQEPMMNCIGERSDGTLYACGANFEPDLFALGSSDDGQTWETTWRFAAFADDREANAPLDCPAGTIQNDTCENGEAWQMLTCNTFMFDWPECEVTGTPDAGTIVIDPDDDPGGCCRVGGGSAPRGTAGAAVLIALWLLVWGRRRPPRR